MSVVSTAFGQPARGSISTVNLPIGRFTTMDSAGNVYIVGTSANQITVTPGAAQSQPGGTCVGFGFGGVICSYSFVMKLAPDGGTVLFATYLGGAGPVAPSSVAVDAADYVYVAASVGGFYPNKACGEGLFAAKLSPDGSRYVYSVCLPGTVGSGNVQNPPAIAADSQGNAYVCGETTSGHAFVTKISADGSSLAYTTTLAGSQQEAARALLVDAAGNVYLTGETSSPDFPTSTGVVQPQIAGAQNAFVAKLDATGTLVLSTFLGGSASDFGNVIRLDSGGNIFVAGAAGSADFPTTPNAFEPAPLTPAWSNTPGGFVAKLSPDFSTLLYSSLVGTTSDRGVTVLAATSAGDVYLSGATSAGYPVTPSAPQPCFGGSNDVFVTHLDSQGTLVDSTYFGSWGNDSVSGLSLAADGSLNLIAQVAPTLYKNQPVLARIRFGDPGATAPPCLALPILNSADLANPGSVSPGEVITLTGFGIGPDAGAVYQPGPLGDVPTELAGVQVLFDGHLAPVLYAQSRQINAIVPDGIAGQSVTTIQVHYGSIVFDPNNVAVTTHNPALFRREPGLSILASVINAEGTVNGASNAASLGSVVTVFGTGFGVTGPAYPSGGLGPAGDANLVLPVQIYVGATQAETLFAGTRSGTLCGVVEFDVRIPDSLSKAGPVSVNYSMRDDLGFSESSSVYGVIFVK